MEPPCGEGDKRDVRRPMNAFLIFCKRHRSIVREKNPDLDNRSVTRILGDLWANLKDSEKLVYTDLAKQYKDAFMKANPDYKWHNPEKGAGTAQKPILPKPTNVKVMKHEVDCLSEGSIMPGKLADPSNMGGLSLLLMAGQQSEDRLPKPLAIDNTSAQCAAPSSSVSLIQQSSDRSGNHGNNTSSKLSVMSSESTFKHLTSKLPDKREISEKKVTTVITDGEVTGMKAGETTVMKTEVKPAFKPPCEPVWQIDGKRIENPLRKDSIVQEDQTKGTATKGYHSLLELAEMCSNQVDPEKPAGKSVVSVCPIKQPIGVPPKAVADTNSKPLLYQAVAAPKQPQRSLLAEAFLETCEKGNYSDILKDNSASFQRPLLDPCSGNFEKKDGKQKGSKEGEKENISKLVITHIKDGKEIEEDSPMIKCGKMVVNHIIDKLFSSDIASAARKLANAHQEKTDKDKNGNFDVKTEQINIKEDTGSNKNCGSVGVGSYQITGDFDEHDGNSEEKEGKGCAITKYSGCSRVEKIVTEEIYSAKKVDKEADSVLKEGVQVQEGTVLDLEKKVKSETDDVETKLPGKGLGRKRSSLSVSSSNDGDVGHGEEELDGEFQPIRKSRRRNRGQRYQELIAEGIIQPSKERIAAQQQVPRDEGCEEDFQSIDTYILPETAIRRIRKRTTSESAKDKIIPLDDPKRYKTGDFDLEAHIATLPACTVESMGRKRGFNRQRHNSETTPWRKPAEEHIPVAAFDLEKAVSLPPHLKIPTPEKNQEPVVGSRKRKARKHSITHLLPAPVSTITSVAAHVSKVADGSHSSMNAEQAQPNVETDCKLANDITVSSSDLKRLADKAVCKAPSDREDSMIPDTRVGCTDVNNDAKVCESESQESLSRFNINCSNDETKDGMSHCGSNEVSKMKEVTVSSDTANCMVHKHYLAPKRDPLYKFDVHKNDTIHRIDSVNDQNQRSGAADSADNAPHLHNFMPHSDNEAKLCQPYVNTAKNAEIQTASMNLAVKQTVSQSNSQKENGKGHETKTSAEVQAREARYGAGNQGNTAENPSIVKPSALRKADVAMAADGTMMVSGAFLTCSAVGVGQVTNLTHSNATFPRSEDVISINETNMKDFKSETASGVHGSDKETASVKMETDLNCNNAV